MLVVPRVRMGEVLAGIARWQNRPENSVGKVEVSKMNALGEVLERHLPQPFPILMEPGYGFFHPGFE